MTGRTDLASPTAVKAALLVTAAVALVGVFVQGVNTVLSEPSASPEGQPPEPPPADAPRAGQVVLSDVTEAREVRVEHWVTSREPVSTITVRADQPDGRPGTPVVRDAVVSSDGVRLARLSHVGDRTQVIPLGSYVTQLYLTYVVAESVDENGTVPGRALARITALSVDYEGESGPVRRALTAPGQVLSVACLRDESSSPRPCGRATDDGGWEVDLDGPDRDDGLLAQTEMQ